MTPDLEAAERRRHLHWLLAHVWAVGWLLCGLVVLGFFDDSAEGALAMVPPLVLNAVWIPGHYRAVAR